MNLTWDAIAAIVGAVFLAGGTIALQKVMRKDVNGLGANQRRSEREMLVLLMTLVSVEDRKWLAEILLRK